MLQNFVHLEVFQKLTINYDLKDPFAMVVSNEKCTDEMLML